MTSTNNETYKGRKPPKEVREQWKKEALELVTTANQHHRDAGALMRRSLLHARKAGDALREAKRRVPYKRWKKFVIENFEGSYETATVYMRVSRMWNDSRIEEARAGNMEPTSIEGFLAIVRNDRQKGQPENNDENDEVDIENKKPDAVELKQLAIAEIIEKLRFEMKRWKREELKTFDKGFENIYPILYKKVRFYYELEYEVCEEDRRPKRIVQRT